MRLRRLSLSGFKTFASRSEVAFDPGITAIVGPNGSGKSNIVDAVRWALGETNARELRGQRMDEVVYAGGGRRPRTNIAEVELLIDNEEGKLAIEGAEVAVHRRVVRGAHDTEYRVNGDRVRLRDLERLLGSTGLTQNGYAVVAQNDIDSIIEATPAQRRVLVEQAAGVRSLRAQCEEVLGRVRGADAVLRRLDDLLADAEPRLEELDSQRAAALEQREITTRLADLRGSLAREEWRAARGRLRHARRRLEQAEGRLEAAAEADSAFAERATAERWRLQRARTLRDEAAARLEAARVAVERAGGEGRRLSDRLERAVLLRSQCQQELAASSADVAALEASLPDDAPREAIEAADAQAAEAATAAEEAAEALDEARAALEDAERLHAALSTAATDVDGRLQQVRLQREMLLDERSRCEEMHASAEGALRALQPALSAAAAGVDSAAAAVIDADTERARRQRAVEAAWAAVNAADAGLARASAAAREAMAAAARLRGAVAGHLGDGGVARAIAAGELSGRRLSECFEVPRAEDAVAVAAALEHHLGSWVVDDASAAMPFLEAEGDREGVLSQTATSPGDGGELATELPGRAAIDALTATPGDRALLGALLARTRLVADESEAGAALSGGATAAVLPDGRVVSAVGVRGGGRPAALLQLVAEERRAGETSASATEAEVQAISIAAQTRERLAEADAAAAEAATAASEARAAAAVSSAALREQQAAEAAATRRRDDGAEALRGVGARLRAVDAEISRLEYTRDASAGELISSAARREAAAAVVAQRRDALAGARRAERDAEAELARLREGAPARTRDEVMRLLDGARHRAEAAEMRLCASECEALAAIAQARPLRHQARDLEAAAGRARDELDTGGVPIADLERIVVGLEAEHAAVAVALARAEDERGAAAAEVEEAEAEVDRLVDEAREEDESSEWDPKAVEKAEREIVRLERRIGALGAVNALAPEQYETLAESVLVLRSGRDDIGAACDDLRRMTRRLAGDLERRFDAAFGAVSVHFQDVFAELFPGGRATLRLEESIVEDDTEDNVEALAERRPGVEILAQPPGKRLCPLRLLSGGERSLTALATVLALQQVNPSPFYIFDEVDAALDDSNVLRFTRLLRRLGQQQQFIVVTHNHITMAAADILWGVTIDGDGVSSVLGVRFDSEAPPELALSSSLRPDERRVAG